MKQPPRLTLLVVIAFFFLFPVRVMAQYTYSYSSIDYDESTNIVSAYAQTSQDYNTHMYYGNASVSSSIKDGYGIALASQASQNGSVSFTALGDGTDSYSIISGHYMMASYSIYAQYSQCNSRYYYSGYLDYYNYQHFEQTPSTPNIYFYYTNFGPGPSCPDESAFKLLASSVATVSRPTLNALSNIWWFNGQSPAFYPLSSTLNASPSNSGSYTFRIASGTDKAGLGSSNAATYFSSANSVDLNSTSFSRSGGDVSATVTVGNWTSAPVSITIHTAYRDVQSVSPYTTSDSTYGYMTTYTYKIYDQFGDPLPYDLPMNEDFPSGWVKDDPNSNWPGTSGNGTMTNDTSFVDLYSGASGSTPQPTGPCQPQYCDTKVHHAYQEYHAGSFTSGQGFRMQTNTAQKYTDHGAAENIVSPAP